MSEHELDLDVVIVGAGWSGLFMLHRIHELGLSVKVLEAGDALGGTWYWNRYPGARCDSPSVDYSYGFSDELQQEWEWTERYATQPEIERYLGHVADRFDLRRDIVLGTRVLSARFDEATQRWQLATSTGRAITARFCVMATGGYSAPLRPEIDGIDSFAGELYFTAQWPDEPVDFANKKIGVIGTGSSGCQVITALGQEPIEHMYVFQRTPAWVIPAFNRPTDPEADREFKRHYAEYRERARASGFGIPYDFEPAGPTVELSDEEFERRMDAGWNIGGPGALAGFPDVFVDAAANRRVADAVRARMRARVNDPETADKLLPHDSIASRRAVFDHGYLETFNDDRVTLVDISASPITKILPSGLRTTTDSYDLDMLIFATGFDSGSGAVMRMSITGQDDVSLSELWADGPRSYLGVMVAGFPNLFVITGPGSPSVRSHVPSAIEQHVEWIAQLIGRMESEQRRTVVPSAEAMDAWSVHVAELVNRLVFANENTTYWGSNVPGKPRVYLAYMGGIANYGKVCNEVRDRGYPGLVFDGRSGPELDHTVLSWSAPTTGAAAL